jgi:heme oxygenase (mycobilin-producing)
MRKLTSYLAAIMLSFSLSPAMADSGPKPVILINAFTVPAEALNETISMWETARDFLKKQPGYISTKLHQSLSPDAKYLLMNVAEWKDAEKYMAATSLMRKEAILPRIKGVVPGPQLYTVIRE